MTTSGNDRTIQIGVEVDSTQAAQGLTQISQAAQTTAQNVARAGQQAGAGLTQIGAAAQRTATEVAQAGQRAGDGLARMGDGAPVAEQRITRSAQSIINSIERTTAALRSGGAQSAEYYQTLANQRGVNPSVLEPYIQRLRQAEAAQLAATQSMSNMGMSARATAAAMRTVPAQFTDIVTSLQAGQNPLTVLLQQGGQLKDQFGGIGAAAKALGGYILGLINPFTVAAAAGIALAVAYEKGIGEARAFERALIASGNQAGVTGAQLIGMAESVDKVAGTQAKAAEVLTLLASSGDVGSASFERFTIAAIAFEQAGGQAAEETVKAFQELGKEPLKAALKLNEAQGFLTASVYEQIKALESQGRTLEAAKVAQEAYASALEQRTPAMQAQLGTLERGWLAVKNATKEAVDEILKIGRAESVDQQIKKLKEAQALAQQTASGAGFGSTGGGAAVGAPVSAARRNEAKAQAAAIGEQIRLLQLAKDLSQDRAKDQANEIRLVKEKAEWDKRGSEYLEKSAKRDKELIAEAVKGRELVNKGLITEAELKERLLGITEKYKEKEKKTATGRKPNEFAGEQEFAKLWAADFKKMRDEATKAEASMLGLSKAQEKLLLFLKSDEYQRASEPMRELVLEQAYAAIAFEQAEEAANAQAKALKEVEKANTDYVESLQKDAAAAGKRLGQLQEENAAAVIAAQANISLAEAIEQVAIARLQEQQAVEMSFGNESAVQAIQDEIDARRELQKEIRTKDARNAQEDATKEAKKEAESAAKEWEKSAEKIENTLTDALMRGFESGKGFAETLRDTVVNMFKTMILRPVVSAIVSPIAQGITGMIAPTAASAGTSLLGNAASSAATSTLFGGTSLGALGSAFGEGFMATLGGSTIGGGGAAGILAGGGAAGTSTAGMLGAAAPYALAAVAALAAIGAFRTTKTVGGGLQGTLGEGDITGYDLRRKSGYLLGGPDYSIRQTGVAAQSATLQKAYTDMRAASVGMADALGLGSDAIKNFTTRLGSDLIHPDTGGLGLKLDGLKPEEVEARIAAAMKSANDEIAAGVLGVKTTVVTTTTKMVEEAVGPLDEWGKASSYAMREVSESMESTTVVARKDLVPWMQRIVDTMGPTSDALQKLYTYSNELLTAVGTSRDEMVKLYAEGLKSGDMAGAGQAVADALVMNIENTMLNMAAGQIFDIMNRGIVTPIIDAMMNGQTLSQALADGAIEATIKKVKEKAEALSAIMNDPRIKELMEGLRKGVSQGLGGAASALNYTPQYQPTTTNANKAAENPAEEGRKKWQDITDDLLGTQSDLLIEKLRAQGREEEALALERERAIKGMDAYQIGLYDSNQQLQTQIDLLNKTNAQRAEYESLGVELLRAQGRETEALAAQRRIDVAGMTDAEIGLYDLNAARRAEIDAIAKNKEALDAFWTAADSTAERYLSKDVLTSYRFDRVAQQINTATGSKITGAMLSALGVDDIKNAVAQFVSSDAPLTAKTQILELGAALIGLGDAARSERDGLIARLNAATDTNEQALARQRDALDESNRALFDQVIAAEKAKEVAAERKGLQDELNSLTDTNAQALQRQRNALDESNRALFDAVQAARKAKEVEEERKSLLERLYGLTDSNSQALERQRGALDESNRALFDQITALELAKATNEQRLGIEGQLLQALGMTAELRKRELDALYPANRALQERLYALQDSRGATDTAYAALERAVAAQRKQADTARQAASELVSEVASIFDILKSSVRELYGEVESTRAMSGVQGMAFIDSALTAARAAGVLPDANDLRDAISGVRGTFGSEQFATQVDADFGRLVLAGKLAELEKISGGQLTNAEQQLASLERANDQYDEMLASYKRQIDTMRGVDTRVLGVGDAIAELQLAMSTEQQITATTMLDVFGAQYDVLLSIDAGIAALNDKQQAAKAASAAVSAAAKTATVGHTTSPWAQWIADTTGPNAREEAIRFALQHADLFGQGNAFVAGAETHMGRIAGAGAVSVTSGGQVSINDLAAQILGITATDQRLTQYGQYQAWLQAELDKLPKFAAGGYHSGGWAMVGEQGPELAYMPPAHIVNAADTRQIMGSDGAVAAKIESLERTVASLLSVIAGNTQRTATVLSDVTDSGTAMRLGETLT